MSLGDSIFADIAPVVSDLAPRVELSVAKGPGQGQLVALRRGAALIGSAKGCKVRLKHSDVSHAHAAIINTGEQIFLRDLLSENGTYLNELAAQHEELEDDDSLKIKPWHFKVQILGPTTRDLGDLTGLGLDPAPAAIGLEDPTTKEIIKLPRDVNLIGRGAGADFAIEDRSISRAHALIFTYLSRPVIFDLLSHNGLKVNGRTATFATIRDEDVITLGMVDVRVRIIEPLSRVKSAGNGEKISAPHPEGTFSDRIDLGAADLDRPQNRRAESTDP